MPKPPSVPKLARELIALLRGGHRPRACMVKAAELEARLDVVTSSHRATGRAATHHGISDDLIAQIRESTHTDGETARRLGISRPTVAKYRKRGKP